MTTGPRLLSLAVLDLLLAQSALAAQGPPPNLLELQARVADAAGTPLNGPVAVRALIYSVPAGGTPLWQEDHPPITATNGLVNLALGSVTPLPLDLFDATDRYLAFRVLSAPGNPNPDPEMVPRLQLLSVPYARRADHAAALESGASIPDGLITSADILDGTIMAADLGMGPFFFVSPSGNVGIGTNTPLGTLHLKGSIPILRMEGGGTGPSNAAYLAFYDSQGTRTGTLGDIGAADSDTYLFSDNSVRLATSGGTRLYVDGATGRIGIGTTSPDDTLDVVGKAHVGVAGPETLKVGVPGGGGSEITLLSNLAGGNPAAITWKDVPGGPVKGSVRASGSVGTLLLGAAGVDRFSIQESGAVTMQWTGGNVGIGTITPQTKLDVAGGDIILDNTRGLVGRRALPGSDLFVGSDVLDRMQIGDGWNTLRFFTSNSEKVTVTAAGNVGIGTTTPTERLHVVGNICATGMITSCSSMRWKENIRSIERARETVEGLRGVYFDWKDSGRHDLGMIAEEVGRVVPEVVMFEANGVDAKSIDYGRLTAVLVEAVKELSAELARKNLEIRELSAAVAEMREGLDAVAEASGVRLPDSTIR